MTTDQLSTPEGVLETYHAKLERIRNSKDLAPDVRTRQLAQAHRAAETLMGQLQQKEEADKARAVTGWKRRAFGSPVDDWAVGDAYRRAVEQAEKLPVEDLRTQFDGAAELGDKLMARALARRAAELGLDDIVTDFADLEPAAGEAARQLAAHLAHDRSRDVLADSGRYWVSEPRELRNLSPGKKRQAAMLPGEAEATRQREAEVLGDFFKSWLHPDKPDYSTGQ